MRCWLNEKIEQRADPYASYSINSADWWNGVRDYNLLDSALETPFQSFGGDELYPTIQAKAARLGYGLIKNHCMIDGNKRIGTHAMLVFLALNGIELKYTQKELYETILNVASGSVDYNGLLQWVLNHQN
mgnify:CR=1 FL=1